jgi:hypothetical protein
MQAKWNNVTADRPLCIKEGAKTVAFDQYYAQGEKRMIIVSDWARTPWLKHSIREGEIYPSNADSKPDVIFGRRKATRQSSFACTFHSVLKDLDYENITSVSKKQWHIY